MSPELNRFMADQDKELCDNCHERPATSHICHGGGEAEPRSLCEVCLKQDPLVGGLMQQFAAAVRTGQCRYCGGPAETGSGSHSFVEGSSHFNLICMECAKDWAEFIRRPENALAPFEKGDEDATRKYIAQFSDRQSRCDEYVRQQVAKRKSK
jgi:hypothetical protein